MEIVSHNSNTPTAKKCSQSSNDNNDLEAQRIESRFNNTVVNIAYVVNNSVLSILNPTSVTVLSSRILDDVKQI